ncbi:MAG: GNAT family N-acetyltransferase [Parasphingopyxis sp.]|uniref:GNAT family N-acetyltransferase n=1 Tax=Parasphingopyxis sp. TaxID=1920299 RepID=UPI003F9EC4B0
MTAIIETERLILRDWRDADREPMYAHVNSRPNVMRYLLGVQTRAKTDEMIDKLIRWQRDHGHTFWAVERKEDGELLGFCGLKKVDDDGVLPDPGTVEIGWRLREDAWGKGYAREAAVASMNHAFDAFDPDFVTAFTVRGNEGSWRLMERLGMERRTDLDHWYDEWGPELGHGIVYRIDRGRWAAKRREFEQGEAKA